MTSTDNGSEFAKLSELEPGSRTKFYFAHSYSFWKKGSIENQCCILQSIHGISAEALS